MKKKNKVIRDFINSVIGNTDSRREIVRRSHLYFFCTYFSKYITYEMAPLHHELFRISEDDKIGLAIISAFRNCGKSVIMNLSYVLWSILGLHNKKFILIVSQTQEQAKQHFANLKKELETNMLLKKDLGPFEQDLTWNTGAIIIPKYNAKIMVCSTEQSIRGIRYNEHRPDLLILDDIEDSNSVKTKESRDKTYYWFDSEMTPIGDKNTKIIILGNILHKDSMIKRLESEIDAGTRDGIYREYPIMDEQKKILWPGKYPTMKEIEEEKRKRNKFTWLREYMLQIVDDHEPVIEKEWIHYYQELPTELRNQSVAFAGGVDLAASMKDRADFSAIVTCKIIGNDNDKKIYIFPNPINAKIKAPVTIDNICTLSKSFGENVNYRFYIEEAGQQIGITQILEDKNIKAVGIGVGGNDKITRLIIVSEWIRSGKIIFPYKGAEQLLDQILNFGLETHDDLVDAFTTLIIGIMKKPPIESCNVMFMDQIGSIYDSANNRRKKVGMGPGSSSSVEFSGGGVFRRY